MSESIFQSGFVSIIGRPNVGKSTLLNRILGEKIVITSDKPQTTRNRIQGILTLPDAQIIFIDTPGIHAPRSMLNKLMVETALASIKGVDAVLFLVESSVAAGERERQILEALAGAESPVFLVINKIDLVSREALLPLIAGYSELFPFKEVIPLSAATGDGVERLVQAVQRVLPSGPRYFPDDILSDVPERFIAAEIIREKVFRLTRDEVPYSVAVVIDSFKEREDGNLISISATINVERDSQKGIIIGRKGEMLKKVGMQARREIEQLMGTKVFLELFVRVSRQWSENPRMLKEFGYE
ncbi:GTPase Era [Geobacter sp. DSM 9736]|uniref:GTPase Era n=1 Tax=Geobacter sp. DSM 9736 TaxID=1277350 RepID=UPI000B5052BB|nr:GTPase Era [Geobacter sp. DSM 9736]SNB45084.1 GTP-binding protein Era [Geobacter sp. DSM 9736]